MGRPVDDAEHNQGLTAAENEPVRGRRTKRHPGDLELEPLYTPA